MRPVVEKGHKLIEQIDRDIHELRRKIEYDWNNFKQSFHYLVDQTGLSDVIYQLKNEVSNDRRNSNKT